MSRNNVFTNPAEQCVAYCPEYFGVELGDLEPTGEFIGPPTREEKAFADYMESLDIPF